MDKTLFELDGRTVTLYSNRRPRILFLQPVDDQDAQRLDAQIQAMDGCPLPWALAAFAVKDWNRELSPWEAPPVFGNQPFGGGAAETLAFVTGRLLPEVCSRLSLGEEAAVCIGGYSLAGLFALWAATETDLFAGAAAASPSVWFPGWLEYEQDHPIRAKNVYLSLGDREERTRNPVMATVGRCIRTLYERLQADHSVTLEWNEGNHFRDSDKRTARAFCRVAAQQSEESDGGAC